MNQFNYFPHKNENLISKFVVDPIHEAANCNNVKNLAAKVLFALSLNFFNAVFNRISARYGIIVYCIFVLKVIIFLIRLQELSACSDENPDYGDLELIQYINVDAVRLARLLSG